MMLPEDREGLQRKPIEPDTIAGRRCNSVYALPARHNSLLQPAAAEPADSSAGGGLRAAAFCWVLTTALLLLGTVLSPIGMSAQSGRQTTNSNQAPPAQVHGRPPAPPSSSSTPSQSEPGTTPAPRSESRPRRVGDPSQD